jgi:hypothetical protein
LAKTGSACPNIARHAATLLRLPPRVQRAEPGLDDRYRDKSGQTREKNSNTRIDTLREIYGPDFAPGLRGDAHLRTLLDRTGCESLSDYLKNRNR